MKIIHVLIFHALELRFVWVGIYCVLWWFGCGCVPLVSISVSIVTELLQYCYNIFTLLLQYCYLCPFLEKSEFPISERNPEIVFKHLIREID